VKSFNFDRINEEAASGSNGQDARSLPALVDMSEVINAPIVTPVDVVEGLLHRGAKMVLGGASKSYKTWTLIDLGLSIATGNPWLTEFPTYRGRVLYINLELQDPFFAVRVKKICEERGFELEPGWFTAWNLRGFAADLSILRPKILDRISGGGYTGIILDPIYKLLGGRDENKAGDVAHLLNEVESMAVQTGAATAFGAHYSKGNQAGKEVIDRIGGSGVFGRDPDSILNFTRHEEEDCFTVDCTLRNHPPVESFVVRWQYPLMRTDSDLDPNKLKKPGAFTAVYESDDLLLKIKDGMTAKQICEVSDEEMGMSRRNTFNVIKQLKKEGKIRQRKSRGPYEIVPRG
jgi:AAA domain